MAAQLGRVGRNAATRLRRSNAPKRPLALGAAAGGGSLFVGAGIAGALAVAGGVGGIYLLERARKRREELER